MKNYTRNEWRTCKTTLEKGGEDVKTRFETTEEDLKLHSKRVENLQNYTRNECNFFMNF